MVQFWSSDSAEYFRENRVLSYFDPHPPPRQVSSGVGINVIIPDCLTGLDGRLDPAADRPADTYNLCLMRRCYLVWTCTHDAICMLHVLQKGGGCVRAAVKVRGGVASSRGRIGVGRSLALTLLSLCFNSAISKLAMRIRSSSRM